MTRENRLENIDFGLIVLESYLSGKIYHICGNSKAIQKKSEKLKKN